MSYKTYATRAEMKADGYAFSDHASECSKCGASIEWATTRKNKKVPFDVGSTQCHFTTYGQAQPAKQEAPATSARSGSAVAQEMLVAMRALNANIIVLNGTLQAFISRLNQRAQPAVSQTPAVEKPNGGSAAAGADAPRTFVGASTFINDHGLEVSDNDVPF